MISKILFTPIGRLYLKMRYKDADTINKALAHKYENSYEMAGITICFKVFGTAVVMFTIFLLLSLISVLVNQ